MIVWLSCGCLVYKPRDPIVDAPPPNAILGFTPLAIDATQNYYNIEGFSTTDPAISTRYDLVKYDVNGNLLWRTPFLTTREVTTQIEQTTLRDYTGPALIRIDAAGNLYVMMTEVVDPEPTVTDTTLFTDYDWYIAKFDGQGIRLWEQRYSSPKVGVDSHDIPTTFHVASDGRVLVTGVSNTFRNFYDGKDVDLEYFGRSNEQLIISYDTDGNLQWQTSVAVEQPKSYLRSIHYDDGGISLLFIGGGGESLVDSEVVVRYDALGNKEWELFFSNTTVVDKEGAFKHLALMAVDHLGNTYLVKYQGSNFRSLLYKINTTGMIEWQVPLADEIQRPMGIVANSLNELVAITAGFTVKKFSETGQLLAEQALPMQSPEDLVDSRFKFYIDSVGNYVISLWTKACAAYFIDSCYTESRYWQEVRLVDALLNEVAQVQVAMADNIYSYDQRLVQSDPLGNLYVGERKYRLNSLLQPALLSVQ